jgi:hypothetical protein
MDYWVVYKRGSFSAKERYPNSEDALNRCLDLLKDARFLKVVAVGDCDDLENCKNWFELRPIKRPVEG